MPTAFDSLQPASFNGTTFPVQKISVKGGLRDHVHEYPHQDGGSPEKLGRKLYVITISAVFANTFPKYQKPPLWPDRLRTLIDLFDAGTTAYLTIPTIGTLKAYATDWDREMSNENLSGESTEITFREDASDVVLDGLFSVGTSDIESLADLISGTQVYGDADGATANLFDQIHDAINDVLSVKDTADLYSNLVTAKIAEVTNLCGQADDLLTLQDPANIQAIDALHDLWAAVIKLGQDVTGSGSTIATYVTPRLMSISEVSAAIFGSTDNAVDILQLNAINDALAIPAGTSLKYFPA